MDTIKHSWPGEKIKHDMPASSSHGFGGDVRDLIAGDLAARYRSHWTGKRFPGHNLDKRGRA
jgi:hypothetical protein